MKLSSLISGLVLAGVTWVQAATNDPTAALQKGLFEEEANHNLEAAIQAYQSVITQFDKDRKLAATAVFRLGECYRKQGNTNDATAQYERVLREFGDQPTLAALSRQNLAGLGGAPTTVTVPGGVVQSATLVKFGAALGERPVPSTSAEAEEVKRIQAIIRDSPDLINAKDAQTGMTPLHQAASKGQLVVAQFLLANGADVDARNPKEKDRTALHYAANNGHKAVVELLLSKGASIQAATSEGMTPLHLASSQGFKTLVEVLLAHKADPNANAQFNTTPLHLATVNGYKSVAEVLLARGADPNAVTAGVYSSTGQFYHGAPLHIAATRADEAMIGLLLANKANVNVAEQDGRTPLDNAAAGGQTAIISTLLAHGADANATWSNNAQRGWTPLTSAIASRHNEAVSLLLKWGAKPDARFEYSDNNKLQTGYTPLLLAMRNGDVSIAEVLLAAKADPNLKSYSGAAPIWNTLYFLGEARSGMLSLLLDHGADVDARGGPDELTPLMWAASSGEMELVQLFLAHGAKTNLQDRSGRSALHWAAIHSTPDGNNNIGVAKLLLAAGADVNLRDKDGKTPLQIAASPVGNPGSPRNPDLAEFLRKHGASENLPMLDAIQTQRPGAGPAKLTFSKGTNDWNQFTLLEVIAAQYGFLQQSPSWQGDYNTMGLSEFASSFRNFPFPDIAKLRLRRPAVDLKSWQEQTADLRPVLEGGDCSKDIFLRWGDVVEIPETDHPLNQQWGGFSAPELMHLKKCLTRKVQVIITGTTNSLHLEPGMTLLGDTVLQIGPRTSFWIKKVLFKSNLLLSSSDLSRVKVTRIDPATGQKREWVLDCSEDKPAPPLWLRDGDVIEVPEKP